MPGAVPMDDTDRKILNLVQKEFPVTSRPLEKIAEPLSLTEDEVLERLRQLKEEGIIRRIGAILDPRSLGWVSTLCAARVSEEKVEDFVEAVNQHPGVTHNYERHAYYNVWFTLTAPSWEEVEKTLAEFSKKTGIDELVHLPAREIFKVKVQFEL